jgi:hypothetical protein
MHRHAVEYSTYPRGPRSGLSLHTPSWHAVLSDPGESNIDMFQNFDADMAFAD